MRLTACINTGILLLLLLVARVILFFAEVPVPLWADVCLGGWVVLSVVYCIVAPLIRYRRYEYQIDSEKVILVEGLWFITKEIAPIERIHQVSVIRGPIDRLYGVAKVVVTTAGGTIVLRFLEIDVAEQIAEHLQTCVSKIVNAQLAAG